MIPERTLALPKETSWFSFAEVIGYYPFSYKARFCNLSYNVSDSEISILGRVDLLKAREFPNWLWFKQKPRTVWNITTSFTHFASTNGHDYSRSVRDELITRALNDADLLLSEDLLSRALEGPFTEVRQYLEMALAEIGKPFVEVKAA